MDQYSQSSSKGVTITDTATLFYEYALSCTYGQFFAVNFHQFSATADKRIFIKIRVVEMVAPQPGGAQSSRLYWSPFPTLPASWRVLQWPLPPGTGTWMGFFCRKYGMIFMNKKVSHTTLCHEIGICRVIVLELLCPGSCHDLPHCTVHSLPNFHPKNIYLFHIPQNS